MSSRFWQRPARAALAFAILAANGGATAAAYSVTNDPYGTVDWDTTLRCQSEHHDHASNATKVVALSNAGYCAITFMTYSGDYRPTSYLLWNAAGKPNPEPGVPTGWGGYRRWPPEQYGAPALPLNSLRFYLPGAEEVGLMGGTEGAQWHSLHMFSLGLTEYIEGVGCSSCGNEGSAVHNNNPFNLPPTHRYASNSDLVAKTIALGAIPVLAHPTGPPDQYDALDPYPKAVEMYNNYHALADEGSAAGVASCAGAPPSHYIDEMRAVWDHVLETKSPRIWGMAVNDHASAWTPLGGSPTPCWPQITEANRDRGKTEVLVTRYDVPSYMDAVEAGAFFAVVEDNAVKAAFPTVTGIEVEFDRITIETAAPIESVTWVGDGQFVAQGATLDLENLPEDLVYVRAEIDDGDGRTVFTQPFSLGPPVPPPPGEPIPILPTGAAILLGVALLAAAIAKAPRLPTRS